MGRLWLQEPDGWRHPLDSDSIEYESPVLRAARIAHLRESRRLEDERFRCEVCGKPGALLDGGDRYHGAGICRGAQ